MRCRVNEIACAFCVISMPALIHIMHPNRKTWRAFEEVSGVDSGTGGERDIYIYALRNYYFAGYTNTFVNWNDLRIVDSTLVACVSAQKIAKAVTLRLSSPRDTATGQTKVGRCGAFLRSRVTFERVASEQKFKGDDTRVSRYIDRTWNIHLSRSAHLPFLFHVTLRACLPLLALARPRPSARCRYRGPLLTPYPSAA